MSYTYDAAQRRSDMTVAGQPQITYTYDDSGRLTNILQGTSAVGFTYDAASRRTGLTLPNGIGAAYTYDAASQLTGIVYAKPDASLLGDLTYTYDANGQRTGISGTLAKVSLPAALTSTTYGPANRLTNWDGTAISYDTNGNMLSDGQLTYTWDVRNRLASISGAATASFQYDAFGRRIGKTVNGIQTGFLYDGINAVQELSGATPSANLLTGLGIDEIFTRTDTSGVKNFVTDALGSTLALTDAAGAIQTQYGYEPYGETTASGAVDTNSFQYTGRENDGTGIYYYRARYFNPKLSRFISEDPIGLAGGLNQYAYVSGNPVSSVDPLGLAEMCYRPIQGYIIPGQHCFIRYGGNDGDTSSFSPSGVGPDPAPKGTTCEKTQDSDNDDCIKREMKKCKNWDFIKNNCCHCAEQALNACRQSIPVKKWPNYPINPGPQPGEKGAK